jgi:Skp family chaperone for outer membrane proteins
MSKTGWIVLLVAGTSAGVVIGAALGSGKGREAAAPVQPSERTEENKRELDREQILLASLEKYRQALAEREEEIGKLREQLAEVTEKLPPPLTPEEEKKQKEEEERRKRDERLKARYAKSKELRTKILQRKDKLMRALGLEELAVLLDSKDPEQFLIGLTTLPSLSHINFDKERFRPQVLAALSDEDAEIRQAAFNCLYTVRPGEDHFRVTLSMAGDPSSEIRGAVAWSIAWATRGEQKEEAMPVLRKLLQDEDQNVRRRVMDALSNFPGWGEEIEGLALELSKDSGNADRMMGWLGRRDNISAKVAQRLVEMNGEREDGYRDIGWTHRRLADDAKPIAADFCLDVVRESIEHWQRWQALDGLRSIGDVSVLPELEQIARSPDAEGIEEQLTQTIEYLQKQARGAR